jgi:hypothetical protein
MIFNNENGFLLNVSEMEEDFEKPKGKKEERRKALKISKVNNGNNKIHMVQTTQQRCFICHAKPNHVGGNVCPFKNHFLLPRGPIKT